MAESLPNAHPAQQALVHLSFGLTIMAAILLVFVREKRSVSLIF